MLRYVVDILSWHDTAPQSPCPPTMQNDQQILDSFPIGLPLVEFQTNSKSPQGFFFSFDGKYMIKTMSERELRR